MDKKVIAICVLAAALFGAIGEVPGFFLNQVMASSIIWACIAFAVCLVISVVKHQRFKKSMEHPVEF